MLITVRTVSLVLLVFGVASCRSQEAPPNALTLDEHLKRGKDFFAASFDGLTGSEAPVPKKPKIEKLDLAALEYQAALLKEPQNVDALLGLSACLQHRGDSHEGKNRQLLYRNALFLHRQALSEVDGKLRRIVEQDIARMEKIIFNKSASGRGEIIHRG
ncbi:MAG: hypothetical protein H7Y17_16255 [Chlorobia bacterium]|nr:hypothetical protein [Fimbriimonadaceae bacterium]